MQSSLHLHLLKTLEFRTDVSVTSMPGVAGATRASHFPITIFPRDPRPETETACQLNRLHPLPAQGWSLAWAQQGADCVLPSEPQGKCATHREGCLALLQPGPQVQTEVLSPCHVVKCLCSVALSHSFLMTFRKESKLLGRSGSKGKGIKTRLMVECTRGLGCLVPWMGAPGYLSC